MAGNLTISALLTLGVDRLRSADQAREPLKPRTAHEPAAARPAPTAAVLTPAAAAPLASGDTPHTPSTPATHLANHGTATALSHLAANRDITTHTLDAELLLAHVLSKTRTHLKHIPNTPPPPTKLATTPTCSNDAPRASP